MISKNPRGDELLEIIHCAEDKAPEFQPLTHALVLARKQGAFLFMFNRWKRLWELPGGVIDPGETVRACAVRELLEETGQTLQPLRFVGVMRFKLQLGEKTEYGALFAGELGDVTTLAPHDEAEQVTLWDLKSEIGEVDPIDRALIDFYPTPN